MLLRSSPFLPTTRLTALVAAALLALAAPARAEKGDRQQPFNISADQQGNAEFGEQMETDFVGHALLSQGSMLLQAHRIVVREAADGYRSALATSDPGEQISFSERGDRPGSTVEGQADQVEYDGRTDTIRFIGHAVLRLLQDHAVANELAGAELIYNNRTETFEGKPGAASPVPNQRVRAVMMPRNATPSAAAPAASSAGVPLKASPSLQPDKAS